VDFGTTSLTVQGSASNSLFLAKIDKTGKWIWAKQVNSTNSITGSGIVADASGLLYLSGSYTGTATFGTTSLQSMGENDIFIAQLDTSGNFRWVKSFGGTGSDVATVLAHDHSGSLYMAGTFSQVVNFGKTILTAPNTSALFIAKLDNSGTVDWVNTGAGNAYVHSLAIDQQGRVFLVGRSTSPLKLGSIDLPHLGIFDILIAQFP
jgi:hypothetical protein